eukprot:TRINITY_DN1322_c0_g1_i3.p1 TRINITY_DN1322_c0_g1~~TRINITY_DN1322_c0_g1_i3.p1  ORF type:complete len:115 (-),score=18.15 TRINITY_DN1322_c0_g1_i3:294-638(-)
MANRGSAFRKTLLRRAVPEKDKIKKWKIVSGDLVEVSFGKDKGKQGTVLKVLRKKNKLVVKGVNITKRFVNKKFAKKQEEQGPFSFAESPIHYSRLALVDPSTGCVYSFTFLAF